MTSVNQQEELKTKSDQSTTIIKIDGEIFGAEAIEQKDMFSASKSIKPELRKNSATAVSKVNLLKLEYSVLRKLTQTSLLNDKKVSFMKKCDKRSFLGNLVNGVLGQRLLVSLLPLLKEKKFDKDVFITNQGEV